MTSPPMRFETLIDCYHDEIYRYLWRLLNNAGRSDSNLEAQDLTQDVFMRAYRAFGRLRQNSNHRAWLYKIATNRVYSALRTEQRQATHSDLLHPEVEKIPAAGNQSPDELLVAGEMLEEIRSMIAIMPQKQAAAVTLRYVQELSYPEIAEALDCSLDSARANVYQGLQRLRRGLRKEYLAE